MGSTRRPESNQSANALATSAACHSMLESNRTLSLSRGWLVLQNQTPAEVPVMIHGGQWVYLTDDGEVIPTTEPERLRMKVQFLLVYDIPEDAPRWVWQCVRDGDYNGLQEYVMQRQPASLTVKETPA